ncbi:MAG: AzlC family ABC transporter permease [Desulfuromonadaceae bacterium]|nr:AzlC family ABC transporter permease [Desulfuromonadaceae bacterium]MDD5107479.1 AzlC family ABC transporter permease [Desulfuromonadaceae bacterium]
MMKSDATETIGNDVIKAGLAAAWPICLGYFPIGLSLGVLAQKGGLAPWQMAAMSILIFAGGSQFITVAMLGAAASPLAIISTVFMVNLRHLLMSSALAVHFPNVSRRFLTLFAYGITDESFAVNLTRFNQGGWNRYSALTLNHAANATWVTSTVLGVYIGQLVPPGAAGVDYALTGMFICLLVFQLRGHIFIITALIAATCSLLAYLWLPGNAYVIVASCSAATAGLILKRTLRKRESTR